MRALGGLFPDVVYLPAERSEFFSGHRNTTFSSVFDLASLGDFWNWDFRHQIVALIFIFSIRGYSASRVHVAVLRNMATVTIDGNSLTVEQINGFRSKFVKSVAIEPSSWGRIASAQKIIKGNTSFCDILLPFSLIFYSTRVSRSLTFRLVHTNSSIWSSNSFHVKRFAGVQIAGVGVWVWNAVPRLCRYVTSSPAHVSNVIDWPTSFLCFALFHAIR